METKEAEYIRKGGTHCPNCGSDQIQGHDIDINAGKAYQNCDCLDCNAEWTDVYTLTACDDLILPEAS